MSETAALDIVNEQQLKKENTVKPRLDYLDVAKGIAILLVIMGHTFTVWKVRINWIFTFHMPLFFILSGYFFKEGRKTNYLKLFKAFILPYWGLNLLKLGLQVAANVKDINFKSQLLGIFYGNAAANNVKISLISAPIIGMTWFLLALFWCRIIYNELNKLAVKYRFSMLWATALLAFASLELTSYICLPFSIMPGITAMLFYHIGRMIKEKDFFNIKFKDIPILIIILSLVIWQCCCSYGFIRLSQNNIKLLADVLGAVIGTFYVVKLSQLLVKIPVVGTFFKWCGKYSIAIYGFHSLDSIILYEIFKILPSFNKIDSWSEYWVYLALRIGVIVALSFVYVSFKNLAIFLINERKNKRLAAKSENTDITEE